MAWNKRQNHLNHVSKPESFIHLLAFYQLATVRYLQGHDYSITATCLLCNQMKAFVCAWSVLCAAFSFIREIDFTPCRGCSLHCCCIGLHCNCTAVAFIPSKPWCANAINHGHQNLVVVVVVGRKAGGFMDGPVEEKENEEFMTDFALLQPAPSAYTTCRAAAWCHFSNTTILRHFFTQTLFL